MTGPAFEGSFEFVEHTADVAVRLRARELAGLFAAAAAAMTEAVTDRASVRATDERTVRVSAGDLDLLLVDWLHELLFLFETEDFLVREADVTITGVDEYVMTAVARGERRDPARHPLKVLPKAVTYHGLQITKTSAGYEATVIFDI